MKRGITQYSIVALAGLVAMGTAWFWGERTGAIGPAWGQLQGRHAAPVRRIYPYSVIPGGVESGAELRSALERDPVARQHYQGFAVNRVSRQVLQKDRTVFVSYRIGTRVFWTKKPVLLKKGEAILTDGVLEARVRCGNRIAEAAQGQTSLLEPGQRTLDTWFEDRPDAPTWNSRSTEEMETPRPVLAKGVFRPELESGIVSGPRGDGGQNYTGGMAGGLGGGGGGIGGGAAGGGAGGKSGDGSSTAGTNTSGAKGTETTTTLSTVPAATVGTWPVASPFQPLSPGVFLPGPAVGIVTGQGSAGQTVVGIVPGGPAFYPSGEWSFSQWQGGGTISFGTGGEGPLPSSQPGRASDQGTGDSSQMVPTDVLEVPASGGGGGGNVPGKEVQTPEPSTTVFGVLGTFGVIAMLMIQRVRLISRELEGGGS